MTFHSIYSAWDHYSVERPQLQWLSIDETNHLDERSVISDRVSSKQIKSQFAVGAMEELWSPHLPVTGEEENLIATQFTF